MDEQVPSEDDNIKADRGIPSVAGNDKKNLIAGGVLVAVAIFAMIVIVLYDMDRTKPQPLTHPEEVTFKGPGGASAPYIVVQTPEPDQAQLQQPEASVAQRIDPNELAMQREALKMALEHQKRMEIRKRSPQMVLDQSTDQIPSSGNTLLSVSAGGASLLSGGGNDPNLAFANRYGNQDVEVVSATQMQNLHALIPQGTMIKGILETAIQSDLPGMVRAIVSDDVYSFDGSHLLISRGSRLVGRYRSGLVRGQTRVFVIWNRLIRSDGVSINIGSIGTDSLGRSGLEGYLDTHFFERFGSSMLLSLIDAGLKIGVEAIDDDDAATVSLNSGSNFSRSAEIALENSINIPPTIHVDQGVRINVFVGKDLDFSQVAGNIPKGY